MGKTHGAKGKRARAGDRGIRGQGAERAGKHSDILRRVQGPLKSSGKAEGRLGSAESFESLLEKSEKLVEEGQLEAALKPALQALSLRQSGLSGKPDDRAALPALKLLAEIYLELGEPSDAASYFLRAVEADPEGEVAYTKKEGGGVEKYFYLSQLSEEGGSESIGWLERGATILRRELAKLPPQKPRTNMQSQDESQPISDLQAKLARALCAQVEIYMTDLSFEPDAEEHCERLINEALPIAAASGTKDPTTLQTLANIRVSQNRMEEARSALKQSLELWGGNTSAPDTQHEASKSRIVPEDLNQAGAAAHNTQIHTPDFATRISLSRLLMETDLFANALNILERLVNEDDQSVEAWYLGGWCLHLLFGQASENADEDGSAEDKQESLENDQDEVKNIEGNTALAYASRDWLSESLRLFELLEYEDVRLKDHAQELVSELENTLGSEQEGDEDGEEAWENESDSNAEAIVGEEAMEVS